MKTLKILITTIIIISLFSCHREDVAIQKPVVITVSAGMKTEDNSTRVWIEKSENTIKGIPDVISHWEQDDENHMHIVIKQGNTTLEATSIKILKFFNNNKSIVFSFELPSGINISQAATIYGALGNDISLSTSDLSKIVLPTSGDKLEDRLVYTFKKEVASLTEIINVNFRHIYSILCLRLQNDMNETYDFPNGSNSLKFSSTGTAWSTSGGEYNMETGTVEGGIQSNDVEFLTKPDGYIVANDIQEYWALVVPQSGLTNNPALNLKQETNQICEIDQQLGERNNPLEKSNTYYIAGRLVKEGNKSKLEFIKNSELDEDKVPHIIEFKTTNSTVNLNILTALLTDGIWIDLNNNGHKDAGEDGARGQTKAYTIPASNTDKMVRVYGRITDFTCSNNGITSLDVSKNSYMVWFRCDNNPITSLNVADSENLELFWCRNNKLKSLVIDKNPKLRTIYCDNLLGNESLEYLNVRDATSLEQLHCQNNKLTSLDVTSNINLGILNITNNKIKTLDLTQNTKLSELYAKNNDLGPSLDLSKNNLVYTMLSSGNSPLRTIYVNQTQNDTPGLLSSRWNKDNFVTYVIKP